MKSGIQSILQSKYQLPKEDLMRLVEDFESLFVKKKTILLKENQMNHYVYFIEKGMVQSTILRDGRQFTIFFALENEVPLSSPHLTSVEPSHYTLEALEDCLLWRIPRKKLTVLLKDSIPLANWSRVLIEEQFLVSTTYFSSIYWMSKRDQYRYVIDNNPELAQRLSLKNLAAWLDITPQSLSRIRADME